MLAVGFIIAAIYMGRKPGPIEIPEESEIVTVQKDTVKVSAEDFGREVLSRLTEDMEGAVPLSFVKAKKAEREGKYYALSFLYQDGTRDIFRFYRKNDKWYLEDKQGNVYGEADFITEYAPAYEKVTESDNQWEVLLMAEPADKELIQYGMETNYDMRLRLAGLVSYHLGRGSALEDALQQAYFSMKMERVLSRCAEREGCAASEEEYAEYLRQKLTYLEQQKGFERLEAPYKEAGTTYREASEAGAYWGRISYSVEKLRQAKQEAFRNGEDTIDGVVYDTADEYWNGYAWKALEEAEETVDFTEFDREFEKAREACMERLWK